MVCLIIGVLNGSFAAALNPQIKIGRLLKYKCLYFKKKSVGKLVGVIYKHDSILLQLEKIKTKSYTTFYASLLLK